jgi:hypothetical protein
VCTGRLWIEQSAAGVRHIGFERHFASRQFEQCLGSRDLFDERRRGSG